jgi:hypothetical protein
MDCQYASSFVRFLAILESSSTQFTTSDGLSRVGLVPVERADSSANANARSKGWIYGLM